MESRAVHTAGALAGGDVLVITGPPGAGKSTIADAFVQSLDQAVLLDGDSYLHAIRRGRIPPWESASHEQNTTVVEALGSAAGRYAAGGYPVVVDGVIGPWFLGRFIEAAATTVHYAILRPTAADAMARATRRAEPSLVDPEPIAHMYAAFADLSEYEAHVIDSTGLDVAETLALLTTGARTGRLRVRASR